MRELSRQKESENERVRDTDARKDAEINLQERLAQGLTRDKKELEVRIEELLHRMDTASGKHKEQHHNTVKYFESQIA